MKKTLTVNINGIIFHIDEDAYNVLSDYLESIKSHFSRTQDGEEIISDIEGRIAEMLKERIGDERQVITIDDIEHVVNVIGQPSEFGEEFAEDTAQSYSTSNGKNTKRLYRDPDNSILGGVCGGMGAYFNADPVWFRIAFVVASIPGFGTPLLVYAVLWIVIPEAKTAVDRLEMKGEKVNISNIEKSVRVEISNLKNKFNDLAKEAKRTYKKKSAINKPEFEGLTNAITRIAELFVKVVLVFAGILLAVIGISFLITLLAAVFGFGYDVFIIESEFVFVSFSKIVEFFLGSVGSSVIFQLGFLLLVGVPIVMILYSGVLLIFGLRRTRYVGITAFNLWLVGLIVTAFFSVKVVADFRQKGVYTEETDLNKIEDRPFIIDVNEDESFQNIYRYHDYFEIDEANMIITTDEEDIYYGIPQLYFKKSKTNKFFADVVYQSRGSSKPEAMERAESIIYNYSSEDGKLLLDPFFKLEDREVWRDQILEIVVYVPIGQNIQLTKELREIISNYRHSPYRLAGETWVMTESGLEESDSIPALIEDEHQEEINETNPEDSSQAEKPVSVISFLWLGFVGAFG